MEHDRLMATAELLTSLKPPSASGITARLNMRRCWQWVSGLTSHEQLLDVLHSSLDLGGPSGAVELHEQQLLLLVVGV
jgi:hypothetical protein